MRKAIKTLSLLMAVLLCLMLLPPGTFASEEVAETHPTADTKEVYEFSADEDGEETGEVESLLEKAEDENLGIETAVRNDYFELVTDGLSQSEAIEWLYAQAGRTNCDIDGNGMWCTDLATAYMNFCWLRANGNDSDPWKLHNPYTTYNANQYDNQFASNVNWLILTRSSTTPQPGDIFVSENDDLGSGKGHIGVVLDNYGGGTTAKIIDMSGGVKPRIKDITWGESRSYNAEHIIRFTYFTPIAIPSAPAMIYCARMVFNSQERIDFSWDTVPGATSYYVHMWKDGVELYLTEIGNNTSFASAPTSPGNYTFIVRAGNSAGYSDDGASFSFCVTDNVPDPVRNVRSDKKTYVAGELVSLQWDSASGTQNYWIYLWKDGTQISMIDKGLSTSHTYSSLMPGLYTFIIRPGNVNGFNEGSENFTFEVHDGSYTIQYDASGGTGVPAAQTKTHGSALTLSGSKPTRDGYIFLGWAESSTATTATYQPGGSYAGNTDITLYAVWHEIEQTPAGAAELLECGYPYEAASVLKQLVGLD